MRLSQLRSGPDGPEEDVLNDPAAPQELDLAEQEAGGGALPSGRSGCGQCCPEPVPDQPKGRGDDQIAAHCDVHSSNAGRAGGLGDLICRHGRARAQPENPHLGDAR